jgi:hypothetical protein
VPRFSRRSTEPPLWEALEPSKRHAVDFAWRVHGAQETWTAKVDVKASILLALEGGVLFTIVSANAKDGFLRGLQGGQRTVELIGAVFLLMAVVAAAIGIFPLLGRTRAHKIQHPDHVVYFGHLRYWDPEDLTARLSRLTTDDEIRMLSRQLIEMGKRNWKKHRWVQLSLSIAAVGVGMVFVAAVVRV